MKSSSNAINFIKLSESLRLKSYKDSKGIWTIGYGTTRIDGNPITKGMTITKDQAAELVNRNERNIRYFL